jgi:hypothetical protein
MDSKALTKAGAHKHLGAVQALVRQHTQEGVHVPKVGAKGGPGRATHMAVRPKKEAVESHGGSG